LSRSVGLHLHEHLRAEIGNTERHDQENRGEDGGFDRHTADRVSGATAKLSEHFR
jgi:hypothetical protein